MIKKEKIKYIGGDAVNGIVIDYKKVMRELNKLIKPYVGDFYVPSPPWYSANWFIDQSERSTGKTTQYLLIGMIMNQMYGTTLELLRDKKEQIRKMHVLKLFDTIMSTDYKYVESITGVWNSITYDAKHFYYCNRDHDTGKLLDVSELPFCHVESIDNVDNIKSLYNNNRASYILVDEFVNSSGVNKESDFLNLCQIISTYRRSRLDVKIVMCANSINPYNIFYKELCVSDVMRKMKFGEEKIVETPLGTHVWVHLVKFTEKVQEKRLINNLKYFGFSNPQLTAITGSTEWALKIYPHLPRCDEYAEEKREKYPVNIYLKFYDKLMAVEFWKSTKIGLYMFIREQTQEPKKIDRIYTLDTAYSKLCRYGLGNGDNVDKLIIRLYKMNRTFYSHNDVGFAFEQYHKSIKV